MKKLVTIITLLTLTGCASDSFLAKEQPTIAGLCSTAMGLATIAGPYAMYVVAACGTEAAVAKLALDPSSGEWLQGLIDKIHYVKA